MLRKLVQFFALGAALYLAKIIAPSLLPAPAPPVAVLVPPGASAEEIARRVEEAILVEEGRRFGWVDSDPVIRRRLAMNMAFLAGEEVGEARLLDEDEKVASALALGMDQSDPVVRRRLAARVRSLLGVGGEAPDEATLAAHLAAHPERFSRPATITLTQLLFRGPDAQARAEAARGLLEGAAPERAEGVDDPIPLLPREQRGSEALFTRSFGADFARALRDAPTAAWSGPMRSPYGLHLVYVRAREEALRPALSEVEDEVRRDYLRSTQEARVGARIAALRERYEVELVETVAVEDAS